MNIYNLKTKYFILLWRGAIHILSYSAEAACLRVYEFVLKCPHASEQEEKEREEEDEEEVKKKEEKGKKKGGGNFDQFQLNEDHNCVCKA